MSNFQSNVQAIIGLKKDALGLQANQQQFSQSEQRLRTPLELAQAKISNDTRMFDLDRAKGFMPIDLRKADAEAGGMELGLARDKQLMPMEVSRYGMENNALGLKNQSSELSLAEQGRMNKFNSSMEVYDRADRSTRSFALGDDARAANESHRLNMQGMRYGMEQQKASDSRAASQFNYQSGRQSTLDLQSDIDWTKRGSQNDYQFSQQRSMDNYQSGRQRTSDTQSDIDWTGRKIQNDYQLSRQRSMDNYQDQDRNYQYGRQRLNDARNDYAYSRDLSAGKYKYADGGPVQDVQAKGFVPVKVSNGEFEFTPEQVANIGAAMLASQE